MRVALGLDVGSTNTKAVLVEADEGRVIPLALASRPTPNTADGLIACVLALVTEVLATGRTPECVGIASMAESGVPFSAEGKPLTPIMRWDGRRGSDQAAALARLIPPRELFEATGVHLGAKTPLAIWRWLREERPTVFGALGSWAGVADLVARAMTGHLVTDHTLAGRSMAYRLPRPGEELQAVFDADLLALAGLDPERMPRVALPGDVATTLTDPRFRAAGLPGGIPVVVASHDHAVGAYFAGARESGDTADSLGTAEAVVMLLPGQPDLERSFAAGLNVVRSVTGRTNALLAGSSSAGSMVAWWRERLGSQAEKVFHDALGRMPASSRHVVLPYLRGRQCPCPDPFAEVGVVAVDVPDVAGPNAADPNAAGVASVDELIARDPVDATLGMFAGVAGQARWMFDAVTTIAAIPAGVIVVCGGPDAADSPLMAMKAVLSPVPMRRVQTPEPVATGAALIACERAGILREAPKAATVAIDASWTGTAPIEAASARHNANSAYRRFVAAAVRETTKSRRTPPSADRLATEPNATEGHLP